MKSVHLRHRGYVVHDCQQKIKQLYELNYLTREEVEKKVKWLLKKDRFVCHEKKGEVSGRQRLLNGINQEGIGIWPTISSIGNRYLDV